MIRIKNSVLSIFTIQLTAFGMSGQPGRAVIKPVVKVLKQEIELF